MAIEVICPNGHQLKVKEKYAGKTGLCPFCKCRVAVPKAITDEDVAALLGRPNQSPPDGEFEEDEASVLQEGIAPRESSAMSLLGGSAVRHTKRCPHCSEDVPYWYATCPKCQQFLSEDAPFSS